MSIVINLTIVKTILIIISTIGVCFIIGWKYGKKIAEYFVDKYGVNCFDCKYYNLDDDYLQSADSCWFRCSKHGTIDRHSYRARYNYRICKDFKSDKE